MNQPIAQQQQQEQDDHGACHTAQYDQHRVRVDLRRMQLVIDGANWPLRRGDRRTPAGNWRRAVVAGVSAVAHARATRGAEAVA